jgi:predicted RNA-binding protein YlxR (DUF448 family)
VKRAHVPVRTCVACRQEAGKWALLRLVRAADGSAHLDSSGRAPGRGAYLHPATACLDLARRRHALERALKAQVPEELWAALAHAAEA